MKKPRRPAKQRVRRPLVETLERRDLLSALSVVNTADSGPGSLRAAIEQANVATAPVTIQFEIPTSDANYVDVDSHLAGGDAQPDAFVITPLSPLPTLNNANASVKIDGRSQSVFGGDSNPFGPEVVIDGSSSGSGPGFLIVRSHGNEIVGLNIHSFSSNGIAVGAGHSNRFAGNYIGTDATGRFAMPNGGDGIRLNNTAKDNLIGGVTAADRNVISGNNMRGITISREGTSFNTIVGNFIGTNASGTNAIPNRLDGISIREGASENIIGTNDDGTNDQSEGNVISGNGEQGIAVGDSGTQGNLIAGNLIGVSPSGTIALPNSLSGVLLSDSTSNNIIGGNGLHSTNVISGNGASGISIVSNSIGNTIAGNHIGTDATGGSAVGNTMFGIFVGDGSDHNRIGTDGDGVGDLSEKNLISGNLLHGVRLGGSAGVVIAGNYIGTNLAGDAAIPNGDSGVQVAYGATLNFIGTNGDGIGDGVEGNLISGNAIDGIQLSGPNTAYNFVAGNRIGTDATGNAALGNQGGGILLVYGTHDNHIGTDGDGISDALERNVISGNAFTGVSIQGGGLTVENNVVAGNLIGTNAAGLQPIPNAFEGIRLWLGAAENLIGTDGDGIADEAERNVIAGNGRNGIWLSPSEASANTIAGNSIGKDFTGATSIANGTGSAVGRLEDGYQPTVNGSNGIGQMETYPVYRDFTPGSHVAVGGKLIVDAISDASGHELQVLDTGTFENTVVDVVPGPLGSNPRNLTAVGTNIYFIADDHIAGTEIRWFDLTDPTLAVSTLDLVPGAASSIINVLVGLEVVGNELFFVTTDENGHFLHWFDTTSISPQVSVVEFGPGISTTDAPGAQTGFVRSGDRVYFTSGGFDQGVELRWVDLASDSPTVHSIDLYQGSSSSRIGDLQLIGDKLYFIGDSSHPNAVSDALRWIDTTSPDPVVNTVTGDLAPINGSAGEAGFISIGSKLYFNASDPLLGHEVFWIDTALETPVVHAIDVNVGSDSSFPHDFRHVDGKLVFVAQTDLQTPKSLHWIYSSLETPVLHTLDLNPNWHTALSTLINDKLFFPASQGVNRTITELSWIDFSVATPSVHTLDIAQGSIYSTSYPSLELWGVEDQNGDKLFFAAFDPVHGMELRWIDASLESPTLQTLDGFSSHHSSSIRGVTRIEEKLFFFAYDSRHGDELRWLDTTEENPDVHIIDMMPGMEGTTNAEMVAVGTKLYFSARDESGPLKLHWIDTSLDEFTVQTLDTDAQLYLNGEATYKQVDSKLFFQVYSPSLGVELGWIDTALSTPTLQILDLNPGSGSSAPAKWTGWLQIDDKLFFNATDPVYGDELRWIDTSLLDPTVHTYDVNPGVRGSNPGESSNYSWLNERRIIAVGEKLYFTAKSEKDGVELRWVDTTSDETDFHTLDLYEGSVGSDAGLYFGYETIDEKLFFNAAAYSSSGDWPTASGLHWIDTRLSDPVPHVIDPWDGSTGVVSDGNGGSVASFVGPESVAVLGNRLYFKTSTEPYGDELGWIDARDPAASINIIDINPGTENSIHAGTTLHTTEDKIFFNASDGQTNSLRWIGNTFRPQSYQTLPFGASFVASSGNKMYGFLDQAFGSLQVGPSTLLLEPDDFGITDGEITLQVGSDGLLHVFVSGTTNEITLPRDPQGFITPLEFTGRDHADDTLRVDLANLPSGFQIQFEGGVGGNDSLEIDDGAATLHSLISHTFVNSSDGSIMIESGASITYSGLEPISDSALAETRIFDFTHPSSEVIELGGSLISGRTHRIDSQESESVDFTAPTEALTVVAGDGDTLRLSDALVGKMHFTVPSVVMEPTAAVTLRIPSVENADQIVVNGTISLDGSLTLDTTGLNPSHGDSFVILDNDGTDPVVGEFTTTLVHPSSGHRSIAGTQFDLDYVGGTANNDVVITYDADADQLDDLQVIASEAYLNSANIKVFPILVSGLDQDATAVVTFGDGSHFVTTNVNSNGSMTVDLSGTELQNGVITIQIESTDNVGNQAEGIAAEVLKITGGPELVFESVTRHQPTTQLTNADELRFRMIFSEQVLQVDPTDFVVAGGSTAGITQVLAVQGTGEIVFEAIVAGGDLETFNGEVGINLAVGQDIEDASAHPLLATDPIVNEVYTVDHDAPQLESIQVGQGQSSVVRNIVVTFDSEVEIDADAFEVRSESGTPVAVSASISPLSGMTTAELTFSGPLTDASGSLLDGIYVLTVKDSHVRDLASNSLDGDSDGSGGGDAIDEFFRMFGDSDSDRDVDSQDYGRFGLTFLQQIGDSSFNASFDHDGDGDVDGQDYGQFGLRFLKQL
ncbi:hypothetical protein Enr13x_78690 [Stieleria neptunia]|uniref:Uncharacterized protein n=1 Tax=Stieleria neptunia TaxID=2527979 RepID=A0A518I4G7_9BACT|nr:hypothetical protein [Stieleria neptunia]QDV47957.1 hypothetical protein Enr13x_78690 [Stieleria neptunia]